MSGDVNVKFPAQMIEPPKRSDGKKWWQSDRCECGEPKPVTWIACVKCLAQESPRG
jgi:hypothetical protein